MPTEVLIPLTTPLNQWEGFPFTTSVHRNVDETLAAIDTSDWNRQIVDNKTIKHTVGKLSNLGTINLIKLAMNVKRYATQGVAALRFNVYLAGSRVVPETEASVDNLISYDQVQQVWLANVFLPPWVGLTGAQWNAEIDLDPNAAQFWLETFTAGSPPPPTLPDYQAT